MAGGFIPSENKSYPGGMTWYVIFACICSGFGGAIFGYDIGISGGVTSMPPFLMKFFPSVYHKEERADSSNQYCKFDNFYLTMFTSSLYVAALIASFFASTVTRKCGRRVSMMVGSLVFFAGAAINAFAANIAMLIIGRLLLGVGVGFSIQSVPLYVSEMAPSHHRGTMNIIFQLSITIGILGANVVNYFSANYERGWRYSLGGACVPAFIIFISALILPNTPNSMLEKGEHEQARAMLRKIRGVTDEEVQAEFNDLLAAGEESKTVPHPWKNLLKRKYRPQFVMAILIPFFQQVTGINVVMFYAPVLLNTLGLGHSASLLSSLISSFVNVLATIVAMYTCDRLGRRFLFIEGGIQMLVFQVFVASFIGWKFGVSGHIGTLPTWYAVVVVGFICAFTAGFAWSWGPLGWLLPSEIFPLEIRSAGQSLVVSVNMFFTFLIAQTFLSLLCHMKFGLFLAFAVFVGIMTVFVYLFLPETKNIPIDEMSKVWRQHWYWKRFVTDDEDGPKGIEDGKLRV